MMKVLLSRKSILILIIKAKGDSMVSLIQNGDYVIAEIDSTPCQGELSLVRVESSGYKDEYTIKKFYRYDSEIKAAQKIVYIIHQSIFSHFMARFLIIP